MIGRGGILVLLVASAFFAACSFDYGAAGGSGNNKPDIVMDNLEYVRVRGGDPLVRIQADHAERWEKTQTMELQDFSFEQMQDHGESVNAEGKAGTATVQLNSGDISLKDGVKIRVNSEDVTISTSTLDWKDKEKTLTGGADAEVDIVRSDGTSFTGYGFSADARNRTWNFTGNVEGQYVEKDDKSKGDQGSNDQAANDQSSSNQSIKDQGTNDQSVNNQNITKKSTSENVSQKPTGNTATSSQTKSSGPDQHPPPLPVDK